MEHVSLTGRIFRGAALTLNRRVRKGLDHKPESLPLRDLLTALAN